MPSFKKRMFGTDVPEDVRLEFDRLATGGQIVEKTSADGEILKSVNPTYEKYELGEKTPFTRMWCAVSINEWNQDAYEKWQGEKIFHNSKKEWFFFPEENEAKGTRTLGKDAEAKRFIFSINEHTGNDYTNPLESTEKKEDNTEKLNFMKQLSVNPLMKPAGGIKTIKVKTQGAVGALLSAKVDFTVHNRFDFENIFLPYFMKPGSIVILDYGWSDVPLYNIIDQVKEKDIDMSDFDKFIYHPKTGWVALNYGKANTLIGNVVNYDVSVTNEGSYDCSIEIISRNAGLLEKTVGGDLQNIFVNTMNDILAVLLQKHWAVSSKHRKLSLEHIRKNLTSADPVDTREIAKTYISEMSDQKDRGKYGFIPKQSVRAGIFHQDMSPNITTSDNSDVYSRITQIHDGTKKASELRRQIVSEETLKKERIYISYGLFEDLFLNNFARGVIKNKVEVSTKGSKKNQKADARIFEFGPGMDYESNFDTRLVYIRYSKTLLQYQRASLEGREELPVIMLPDNWDDSYNSRQVMKINLKEKDKEKWPDKDSDIKWNVSTEDMAGGKHPNYPGVKVMPLRDLFVAVSVIQTAFESKDTVNDALVQIYDEINSASGNVMGLKIFTDTSSTAISVQDINLLPVNDDTLKFDVTGPTSIVSSFDMKYSTPKDGLASILAIGNMSGPQRFEDLDLSQFSYLNLLNKPQIPGQYIHIRSLPSQGNMNRFTDQEDGLSLNFAGINRFLKNYDPGYVEVSKGTAESKSQFYYEQLKEEGVIEQETKEESEENQGVTSDYKQDKSYAYALKAGKAYGSERDMIRAKLRAELHDSNDPGSIPPILPIELTLGVYGNTYLQIGDRFTINYLPDYYRDLVNFQIVGFEDSIDPNGWTTTYESVMRVQPKQKSMVTGIREDKPPPKVADNLEAPNIFPRSTTTSVLRAQNEAPKVVSEVCDSISSYKELKIDHFDDNDIAKLYQDTGIGYKVRVITFEPAESWNEKIKNKKKDKDYTYLLQYDFASIRTWEKLNSGNNLAYAYAVRKALLGEHGEDTFMDFSKGKGGHMFSEIGLDGSDVINQSLELFSKNEIFSIWHMDDRATVTGIETDIWDNIDKWKDWKREAVLQVDFKLNEALKKNMGGLHEDVSKEDLTYEYTFTDKTPLLVKKFYFGLDRKSTERQQLIVLEVVENSGITVFPYIPIPVHLLKEGKTYKDVIKRIVECYKEYKTKLYEEEDLFQDSIGNLGNQKAMMDDIQQQYIT